MKICKICKTTQTIECFKQNDTYKDGYQNRCKSCDKEYNQSNKERFAKNNKLWRAKNIDRLKLQDSIRDHDPLRRFKKSVHVSKRRKLEWEISLEDFEMLCPLPCYYCNNKLEDRTKSTYCALDRKDNSKGYCLDNILPCCATCNYLRGDILTVDETLKLVSLLIELRGLT